EAEIFWRLREKNFLLGLILASLAMTAGYTLVGAFLYDSLSAGIASTPGLLLKSAVNIFVVIILGAAIRR
ncbi:MAG: ECF transporter S component, partial [Selenomonadaceae bacterium]|nr:ECF transporter S component [Selenomonadaceae bacterium]